MLLAASGESELAGPTSGRKCYITPAFSRTPNKGGKIKAKKNKKNKKAGRKLLCGGGGGGGARKPIFPTPPPPSLAAVTGGGVQGGGARPAVPGGRGVNPTSMAQIDTHVALIILTTQMWGGGGGGQGIIGGNNFRTKFCVRRQHLFLHKTKGPTRNPISPTPPPPSAGVHVTPPPPPPQSNFQVAKQKFSHDVHDPA